LPVAVPLATFALMAPCVDALRLERIDSALLAVVPEAFLGNDLTLAR